MATLAQIVERGIPLVYRIKYDFNFWKPEVNKVVKLIVMMAVLPENIQEFGVVINGGRWINIPTLCRKPVDVYNAVDENSHYPFSIVNNRVKLKDTVDSATALKTSLMYYDNQNMILTGVTLEAAEGYIGSSIIDDAGYVHTIADVSLNVADSTINLALKYDVEELYGLNPTRSVPFNAIIVASEDCYMLKGIFDYPEVVSEYDEVPLSDKYEAAIVTGLRLAIQKEQEDTAQISAWLQLMQWEMGTLKLDEGILKKIQSELGAMNATAS